MTPTSFKNDSHCQYIENSIYNQYGLENNFQLDWFDLDEDGEWDECDGIFCEGEKWYNYGFDHVQDNFESGCFNDDANPYGSRPFKRLNYINKFLTLTKGVINKKESDRFLKDVQNLKKLKSSQLNKLNIVINKKDIKKNNKLGIF